jgi:hypothetical protein
MLVVELNLFFGVGAGAGAEAAETPAREAFFCFWKPFSPGSFNRD